MLSAVRTNTFLPYRGLDSGTSRCRVCPSLLMKWKAGIGYIVQLQLSICAGSSTYEAEVSVVEVLCTVWPDTVACLGERSESQCDYALSIDDSVVISKTMKRLEWSVCNCTLVSISPSRSCTSFSLTESNNEINGLSKSPSSLSSSPFLGMPLRSGCTVYLPSLLCTVSETNPASGPTQVATVVSGGTLLLSNQTNKSIAINRDSSAGIICRAERNANSSSSSSSKLAVVDEIINRVVVASIDAPETLGASGLLLLGPPGTGKTYSVKAVKEVCRDWCTIHVFEINIPELLADADPLKVLDEKIQLVDGQMKQTATFVNAVDDGVCSRSVASTPLSSSKYFVGDETSSSSTSPLRGSTSAASCASPSVAVSATPTPKKFVHRTPGSSTTLKVPQTPVSSSSSSSGRSITNGSVSRFKAALSSPQPVITPSQATTTTTTTPQQEKNIQPLHSLPELSFVVIDEIDALGVSASDNEGQRIIKHRIFDWLDSLRWRRYRQQQQQQQLVPVCVIGTSNRGTDVDAGFRRGGRLEKELIVLTSASDRSLLVRSLLVPLLQLLGWTSTITTWDSRSSNDTNREENDNYNERKESEFLSSIAEELGARTGGYAAADIVALMRQMSEDATTLRSNSRATKSKVEGVAAKKEAAATNVEVTTKTAVGWLELIIQLLDKARQSVGPSCLRGVSVQVPKSSFLDIIGYESVKDKLRRVLSYHSPQFRKQMNRFGVKYQGGILLHGPPGNAKTRLVAAAASQFGLPVISLSAADVFSPYVGDAEAIIRQAFQVARQASPCVLFFDEMDSMVTNRDSLGGGGAGGSSSSNVESRILATMLTEMDGINSTNSESGASHSNQVIVLAATNRVDFIDAALIRKGRFHHVIHVPPPNAHERELLFRHFCKKCQLSESRIKLLRETVDSISGTTILTREGLSGVDIENACREAAVDCIRDEILLTTKTITFMSGDTDTGTGTGSCIHTDTTTSATSFKSNSISGAVSRNASDTCILADTSRNNYDSEFADFIILRCPVDSWQQYKKVRLRALKESPEVFGSCYEDQVLFTDQKWQALVANKSFARFLAVKRRSSGSSSNEELLTDGEDVIVVGLVAGVPSASESTDAELISMWVAPEARGLGIGTALVETVKHWASTMTIGGEDSISISISSNSSGTHSHSAAPSNGNSEESNNSSSSSESSNNNNNNSSSNMNPHRFKRLLLDVTNENVAGQRLYQRCGFVQTGKVGTMPPPREHIAEHQLCFYLG